MPDRLTETAAQPIQVVSPEVLPDQRVTFRLYAPRATSVTVDGDWIAQGLGQGGPLTRDEQGVWSLTVGPLPADYYMYTYDVDGVNTLDPQNHAVKMGNSPSKSILYVPGAEAAFEGIRDVPHGEVRAVWYPSPAVGGTRSIHVYTPPGYEASDEAYPVLYLMHGGGDDDRTWTVIGRANFILDNLIAENKVAPMIVVMPNGTTRSLGTRRLYGDDRYDPDKIKARIDEISRYHDMFVDDLLGTIIPLVDGRYRVKTDRLSRAMAGLSMGGAETLRAAPSHLELFAYIGVMSMGLQVGHDQGVNDDFVQRNATFFGHPDQTNQLCRLFWIGAGDNDQVVTDGPRKLDACLTQYGINHVFHETDGGHTWINWRKYLHEFAPLLFK